MAEYRNIQYIKAYQFDRIYVAMPLLFIFKLFFKLIIRLNHLKINQSLTESSLWVTFRSNYVKLYHAYDNVSSNAHIEMVPCGTFSRIIAIGNILINRLQTK